MSSAEQNEGGATSKPQNNEMETSMMTEVVDKTKLGHDGNVR